MFYVDRAVWFFRVLRVMPILGVLRWVCFVSLFLNTAKFFEDRSEALLSSNLEIHHFIQNISKKKRLIDSEKLLDLMGKTIEENEIFLQKKNLPKASFHEIAGPSLVSANSFPFKNEFLDFDLTSDAEQIPDCLKRNSLEEPEMSTISSISSQEDWDEVCCYSGRLFSFDLEFLYLFSMLENLRYGEKVPQETNAEPVCANIEQKFSFDPGGRVSLKTLSEDGWELGAAWTYYEAKPSSVSAFNEEYGIYTSMQAPVFVTTGNPLCQGLRGSWSMRMNVFGLELKKLFLVTNNLFFSPVLGAQGAVFRHSLHVSYQNYRIDDATANSPQGVKGRNRLWAVGPEVGIESRFQTNQNLALSLKGIYAGMLGQFQAQTTYCDLLLSPEGLIKIRDNSTRLFSAWQVQAAASKYWEVGKGKVELMLGWETQFWTGINRWDFFSTFSVPSSDGNLMLAGPFARFTASF